MSARPDGKLDVRLVPMTREQRDWMTLLPGRDYPSLMRIVDAWDAAPADPAEAVQDALEEQGYYFAVNAVMKALGVSVGAPNTNQEQA